MKSLITIFLVFSCLLVFAQSASIPKNQAVQASSQNKNDASRVALERDFYEKMYRQAKVEADRAHADMWVFIGAEIAIVVLALLITIGGQYFNNIKTVKQKLVSFQQRILRSFNDRQREINGYVAEANKAQLTQLSLDYQKYLHELQDFIAKTNDRIDTQFLDIKSDLNDFKKTVKLKEIKNVALTDEEIEQVRLQRELIVTKFDALSKKIDNDLYEQADFDNLLMFLDEQLDKEVDSEVDKDFLAIHYKLTGHGVVKEIANKLFEKLSKIKGKIFIQSGRRISEASKLAGFPSREYYTYAFRRVLE